MNKEKEMNYYDFNTADKQFDLIKKGTLAKVCMRIKCGGYNDQSKSWTKGYATKNDLTGSIYLSCEFTILAGEYKGRKVWSLIGLYSDKNNNRWGDMGRSFLRGILNSSKGFTDKDVSDDAIAARKIESFAQLDGIEFVAKIDVENDENGGEKNVIKTAITKEHKNYHQLMTGAVVVDKTSW